ncbi:MAG: hypothetical protein GVY08_15575 [Bacteroidetes bacterium]|jgi:hypothetical protein|nr:hypothetical protein [Bacteroidota bacterium]
MIFDKPEIFYKQFPYKYWLFKAEMLHEMIERDESNFNDKDGNLEALGGSSKEFQQMLKYELHFTYYHQAEALFELIFALEKVMSESKYVWLEMSQYKPRDMQRFTKKIQRLANGSDELRTKKVNLTDGREISFYEWLIYDAFVPEIKKSEEQVKVSTEKVDDILLFAAKDLSDKKEYNAFKHGMRVLHLFDHFKIGDKEKNKFELNFDLKNSFTYVNYPKNKQRSDGKAGDVQAVTKGYSPKQDLMKIKLITMLMTGIIEVRKMRFFGTGRIMEFLEFDINKKLAELSPRTENLTYTLHAKSEDDD